MQRTEIFKHKNYNYKFPSLFQLKIKALQLMSFMGFLKYKLVKIPHRSITVQGCDSYNGLSQGLGLRNSNVVVIRLEHW